MTPDFGTVTLSPTETARQAIGALRGYAYQLHRSLLAWLTLDHGQVLLLELAEDFAILVSEGFEAFQVKKSAAPATLRTKGVVDAIEAYWRLRAANPGRVVRLTYLATSDVGREQGMAFPDSVPGLRYWRVAARDGGDVGPLRSALLSLPLSEGLRRWIDTASEAELRSDLLRPVQWSFRAEGPGELDRIVRERLIALGEQMGLVPGDVEGLRDTLLAIVLARITGTAERRLVRADLLRCMEEATSVSVPRSALRRLLSDENAVPTPYRGSAMASPSLLPAGSIPLPERATDRAGLVADLRTALARRGSLWLHGSSGVGKTILGQLVARTSTLPWLVLQLRSCESADLDGRLAAAQAALASGIGGVIIDDVPNGQVLNARLRLAAICEVARAADASVIVTSARPPPPTVAGSMGDGGPVIRRAPYLTVEDVATIVASAGGDPGQWARIVHAFCGNGHPQLVDARIGGLVRRGWPLGELLAGVDPTADPAFEVEAQREAVRAKLLDELPDGATGLLYRLALVMGSFDRAMALSVAAVDPRLRRPGESLEVLVGPWVEARGEGGYAVSPLVDDVGERILDEEEKAAVHHAIVEDLIGRDPFPGQHTVSLLMHGLRISHQAGLSHLAAMVMGEFYRDTGTFDAIAREIGVLASMDLYDDRPFLPEAPSLSGLLRLAQFKVAAAVRPRRLAPVARRLVYEARMLTATDRPSFAQAALATVLMEPDLPIGAPEWMGWLNELRLLSGGAVTPVSVPRPDLRNDQGWTLTQHLFAIRATSPRDTDDLRAMLTELHELGPEQRSSYIHALGGPLGGLHMAVQTAWERTVKADGFAVRDAVRAFGDLRELAAGWGWNELAVECGCAEVALIDEHAGDAVAARSAMETLNLEYPDAPRADRAHLNLLHRHGSHAECKSLAERMAGRTVTGEGIETALALRAGAISAAIYGDLGAACDLFLGALAALPAWPRTGAAIVTGLLADAATAAWYRGATRDAMSLLVRSAIAAGDVEVGSGLAARWSLKALAHMILHLREGLRSPPGTQQQRSLPPGFCSRLEPPPEIMGEPVPPIVAIWYLLAALEADLGEDLGIFVALRHRTQGRRHPFYETAFADDYLGRHIRRLDTTGFLEQLPDYLACAVHRVRYRAELAAMDAALPIAEEMKRPDPGEWCRQPVRDLAEGAVIAFAAAAIANGIPTAVPTLQTGLGAGTVDRELFSLLADAGETPPGEGRLRVAAWSLGRLRGAHELDPDGLYLATAHLWSWLVDSMFRRAVERALALHLSRLWRLLATRQGFRLRSPVLTVPAIRAATGDHREDAASIAVLILAAEPAVRHQLSIDLRNRLRSWAADRTSSEFETASDRPATRSAMH